MIEKEINSNKALEKALKKVLKPGRYSGGEHGQIVKDKKNIKCRIAFGFPDTYEIGMSNLGVRILYGVLNSFDDIWCERFYAPWYDMEDEMRKNDIPLFALESRDAVKDFDIAAFSLQYELCYTNVLYMLDLAGIPLTAAERLDHDDIPIILGGGPCAYNAEPMAEFFDLFAVGEGEESFAELARLYITMRDGGNYTKRGFLREAAKIGGIYVPSFYDVQYNDDGTISGFTPLYDDIPKRIQKRIIGDMNASFYPDTFVVPYIETVHDRIILETFRGCIRGCRFCQAGMTFRPVREKSPETLNAQARKLFDTCGYEEISLSSLSISDYSELGKLTDSLLGWTEDNNVNLSLPSMRADAFGQELMDKIKSVRMGGLTFAPEAGTQRLRDAINKNLTEEEIYSALRTSFKSGKSAVKLYFMLGLPTETDEDIFGIAELARGCVKLYYEMKDAGVRVGARPPEMSVSVACFIPKPFTPFQWEAQETLDELRRKQTMLNANIKSKHIKYSWHEAKISRIEAVFARGNRKLSAAILSAYRRGMRNDSWDEYFSYEGWLDVFRETEIDPDFYANREFGEDEILPWDIIDCGVSKEFLLRERHKAYSCETTQNCAEKCSGCGANNLAGGVNKWCPKSSIQT